METHNAPLTQSAPLVEWMKQNGFEVKTLAARLEFNPSSIYKFLNGDRPASWEFRHRFSIAFGMEKANEIFGAADVERVAS